MSVLAVALREEYQRGFGLERTIEEKERNFEPVDALSQREKELAEVKRLAEVAHIYSGTTTRTYPENSRYGLPVFSPFIYRERANGEVSLPLAYASLEG